MEYIIGLIILVILAILAMMVMTMIYHLFYGVMPIMVLLMVSIGLLVGLWNAIKNTISVVKDVYGKKQEGV